MERFLVRLAEVWWLAALITAVVVGVVAAVFLFRRRLWQLAASSRFLVVSFVFHLLLVLLLAVWSLPTVVDVMVSKLYEADAAAQPFDNNQHQSHEEGQEAWEKLADLKALDTSVDFVRRDTEPFNIPSESKLLQPTISLDMARLLPSDRVLYVPPDRPAEPQEPAKVNMSERMLAQPAVPLEIADPSEQVVPQVAPVPDRPEFVASQDLPRAAAENRTLAEDKPLPFNPSVVRPVEPELPAWLEQPVPSDPQTLPSSLPRQTRAVQAVVEITADQQDSIIPATTSEVSAVVTEPDAIPRRESSAARLEPDSPPRIRPARLPATTPGPARSDLADAAPAAVTSASRVRPGPSVNMQLDEEAQPVAVSPAALAASPLPVPRDSPPELARGDVSPPSVEVRTLPESAGPARPNRRLAVGQLSARIVAVPPAFAPHASPLQRTRARASRVVFAEDNVGMQEMFTLRQGDIRKQYIELFGGTPDSESAVNHGLEWLKLHQNADGSWSLHNFHENCKGKHANCPGAGSERSNSAATGLALLPFLAAGHTHQAGDYQPQIALAVKWLATQQKENGDLLGAGDQQRLYSHSIAAIALCEVYGMTRDPQLEPIVRKALDFIVKAQHAGSGGWRYEPNQPGDTSVVGWAMMALKSGEMAGIASPPATLDNVQRWLQRVEGNKQKGGGVFGYQNASVSPAMTAEGLLCLQFLGTKRDSPRLRAGADYLLQNLPQPDQARTSYYWYYGTQVMYHMQGPYWDAWNAKLRDHLVASQIKDGPLAGTWDPKDSWEQRAGRVYATALKLLMLEVYYRHLPLYHQLEEY